MSDAPGKEMIVTAIEHDGTKWILNQAVPGDATTKVVKMFLLDGVLEIFALPLPGSDLDKMGQGLHFTLMPLSIKVVASVASFLDWKKLVAETEAALEASDEDDDDTDEDDEEDDEEEDAPSDGPVGYGPPPAVGGFTAPTFMPGPGAPAPAAFAPAPEQVPVPVALPATEVPAQSPYAAAVAASIAEPAPGQ